MITCTRKLEFDAAHRIINHESKCKMLHGHRYVIEVTFVSEELDKLGRVIDFGIVKEILGSWIDTNLDHNVILSREDKELGDYISNYTGQKIYYLEYNPTAENIAKHILEDICPNLFLNEGLRCKSIKLFETPNCHVEASF